MVKVALLMGTLSQHFFSFYLFPVLSCWLLIKAVLREQFYLGEVRLQNDTKCSSEEEVHPNKAV